MEKHTILEHYFGYREFRPGQEELINGVLAGRDVFGIMPTGGGKSICYQVPAMMLPGVTLVVSPLISLMRDQVLALKAAGVPAAHINSTLNNAQIQAVYRNLLARQGSQYPRLCGVLQCYAAGHGEKEAKNHDGLQAGVRGRRVKSILVWKRILGENP